MFVYVFEKKIPVEVRGLGKLPLLIVGPASLFKKEGLLPKELYDHFTVYFVDLFQSDEDCDLLDYKNITLQHFVDAIEGIRVQLELDKMVLFGHSSNGVLALEYTNKHPDRVLFNILVGTMPIWGNYRKNITLNFFEDNASEKRKEINQQSQSIFKDEILAAPYSPRQPMQQFIKQYKSRKAQFFGDDNLIQSRQAIDDLWNNIRLDEDLVNRYFEVISDYDLRLKEVSAIPAFIALGLYDASCPFYAWTDDIKKWFGNVSFDNLFKIHIFDSDHYPMSPLLNQAKPALFMEELKKLMKYFLPSEPNKTLLF